MYIPPVLIASFVSGIIAVLILLHHGWKHSHDDANSHARSESCMAVCFFQPSDVCNFKTWNHENFVIFFSALSLVLAFISLFYLG
jgi:hypothetical protein